MSRKLIAYLAILGIALGAVAASRDLARDAQPIETKGCCAAFTDDRTN